MRRHLRFQFGVRGSAKGADAGDGVAGLFGLARYLKGYRQIMVAIEVVGVDGCGALPRGDARDCVLNRIDGQCPAVVRSRRRFSEFVLVDAATVVTAEARA